MIRICLLACLACTGHGRRVEASSQSHSLAVMNQLHSDRRAVGADSPHPLEALAMLTLALNPAAGFQASGVLMADAASSRSRPVVSRMLSRLRHQSSVTRMLAHQVAHVTSLEELENLQEAEELLARVARRRVLQGFGGLLGAAAVPKPASANYKILKQQQDEFLRRKAGNITEAERERARINEARADEFERKMAKENEKKPWEVKRYCAGKPESNDPRYEVICDIVGATKADQSNTIVDEFGNSDVGEYERRQLVRQQEREAAERARKEFAATQASEAAKAAPKKR